MTATLPQAGTRITALPDPHPDVSPADVASALVAVARLGAVPVVVGDPAVLGECIACAPLQAGGPDPAAAVLCHRESDDARAWIHSWPLCAAHLVREVQPVLAKRVPVWVECPRVVLEP